jgi:flagellar protein FlaG
MRYSLEFVVEQKDRSLTVRVLDSEGEVIREIPPEEIRNLQKRLLEMMGVLFDQKEGS